MDKKSRNSMLYGEWSKIIFFVSILCRFLSSKFSMF